jgi:hypothetical protein
MIYIFSVFYGAQTAFTVSTRTLNFPLPSIRWVESTSSISVFLRPAFILYHIYKTSLSKKRILHYSIFSTLLLQSPLLCPNILLSTLLSNTLSLESSHNIRRPSHVYILVRIFTHSSDDRLGLGLIAGLVGLSNKQWLHFTNHDHSQSSVLSHRLHCALWQQTRISTAEVPLIPRTRPRRLVASHTSLLPI